MPHALQGGELLSRGAGASKASLGSLTSSACRGASLRGAALPAVQCLQWLVQQNSVSFFTEILGHCRSLCVRWLRHTKP